MNISKELIEKAKGAASAEELAAMAKESGTELTAEDAQRFFADLHRTGELADDELDNVAGGSFCFDETYEKDEIEMVGDTIICKGCGAQAPCTVRNGMDENAAYTEYKCPNCGNVYHWYWNYQIWVLMD